MTPMAHDALTRAIKEGNRLFGSLREYLEKLRNGELSKKEREDLHALSEEIFLFEEQLHRKSYGDDLLILSPMAHTLSNLVKAMMLGKGLGCVMLSLSTALMPANGEGKGTKLLGSALEHYAKKLVALFDSVFFKGLEKSKKDFFENMALVYLGASFSLGVLALGVEKKGFEEASEEIKKRVQLTKEIAMVYASLFLQMVIKQGFVEVCINGNNLKQPYGIDLGIRPEAVISACLEFSFLSCFIQGISSQDRRKGEYLFKQLLGSLKERAAVFERFATESLADVDSPINATVTELKFSLESADLNLFIEALNGLIAALGIDEEAFYSDLEDLHQLIQSLAFIISVEELRDATAKHTGAVQV